MSIFAGERISLQSRLAAMMATAYPNADIVYEDVEYDPVVGKSWVVVLIVSSPEARYSTIGSTKWVRKRNILQVNINNPANFGTKPNEVMAEAIAAIFTGQIQDQGNPLITFFPPTLKSAGSRNGFSTGILSIPYQVDYQEP